MALIVVFLTGCSGTVFSTMIEGNNLFMKLFPILYAVPQGIEVTPINPSIAKGTTQQMRATAIYAVRTEDVTNAVTWTSSDESIVTVSSDGLATSVAAVSPGAVTITASWNGKTGSTTLTVTSAVIMSLQVTEKTVSLPTGLKYQFKATGLFSDSSTQDLTSDPSIVWQTSNGGVASISSTGQATAGATTGTPATITATYQTASDTATITATAASLVGVELSPDVPTIAMNNKQQFSATGTFSDSSTLDLTNLSNWTSASTGVATISSASPDWGLATSVSAGTAQIRVRYGGSFSSCSDADTDCTTLTVQNCNLTSISVTPTNPVILGTTQQFTATGVYSNCSSQNLTNVVTWSSDDTNILGVSNAAGSKGLATTVNSGTTTVTATLGAVSGNTSVEVRVARLTSIVVLPATPSINVGQTRSFTATGTYSDGTQMDLTTQVVWSSSNTAVASISNASPNWGHARGLSGGSSTISAVKDGVTGSTTLSVVADTTAPTVVSAVLTVGTPSYVTVTLSESVNVTQAGDPDNVVSGEPVWKIVTTVAGTCGAGDNFSSSTQTTDFSISSVETVSPSVYRLYLSAGTNQTTYTVLVNNVSGSAGRIRDLAASPNYISCFNTASFAGVDTVKPYLVSVASDTPTSIIVTFSEDMKNTGGGTADVTVNTNWTIAEDDTSTNNDTCTDPTSPSVDSVTKISEVTYKLNITWSQCAIRYKITAASTLTDKAPSPNTMGSPLALSVVGNEAIKVVSAEALTTTTVKVTFSKAVKTDAACSSVSDCAERYKLSGPSSLGNITGAVVGGGSETNTVTLTHQTEQMGYAYTVIVANNRDGDNFNNTANGFKGIRNLLDTEYVQAQPKDRATFIGKGTTIDSFDDGSYFVDPFVDGSRFSFAFNFDNKVYLGTNDYNSAAFRFEPGGSNATLVTFGWAFTPTTCASAIGFGYLSTGTCGPLGEIGPEGEYGVVGFTALTHTISGSDYRVVYAGQLVNGADRVYYTQDVDTILDWTYASFTATGGSNTKSVQTFGTAGDRLYTCLASSQNTQAPVVAIHTLTQSGGVVTVGAGSDLALRSLNYIGKNASIDNPSKVTYTASVVGIDSILYIPSTGSPTPANTLYMANNGGLVYSTTTPPTAAGDFSLALSLRPEERGNTTLALPYAPAGLEKLSPGQRGVPFLVVYKNVLYMARNIAFANSQTDQVVNNDAELWKCSANCGSSANWSLVDSASSFTGGTNNKAISLLAVNGDTLYIGFDNSTNGITVFRTTSGTITGAGSFSQQYASGFGGSYVKIYSNTSISDGVSNYLYIVVGDGSNAIRVFRQTD